MKTKTLAFFGAVTLFAALTFSIQTFAQNTQDQFITFDAPGAGPVGTMPQSINPAGAITGYYWDANYATHGFLRTSDGTITTFDAPGAAITTNFGTQALSIDPAGEITGQFEDVSGAYHGFLRSADGTIATFDVPGAGTGSILWTLASSINPAGEITGYYETAPPNFLRRPGRPHGFLRAKDGTITTFDAPGADQTTPQSINPRGEITGSYNDTTGEHGFLRAADGTFTTFDAPGADQATPQSINPKSVIR